MIMATEADVGDSPDYFCQKVGGGPILGNPHSFPKIVGIILLISL